MEAVVHDRYGSADVLELRDVRRPTVSDDVVLVRVHAAGVDPGVWHAIDYTRDDFTRTGRRYDVILDTAGNRSLSQPRSALAARGTAVIVGGEGGGRWLGGAVDSCGRSRCRRSCASESTMRREDLDLLREMIEAGKVTPLVDRTCPLHEAPAALRHLETGHAREKVVLTVADTGAPAVRP